MPFRFLNPALGALSVTLALAGSARAGTSDGACLEDFSLVNFQPESPTHGQSVSSRAYRGRTTVVLLLRSS